MIFDLLHNNKLNREIVHKLPGYTSNYYVMMDNLTTTTLPPSTTTLHPGVHLLLEQAVGIAAFFVLLIVFACIVYFCDMCRYVSNCIRDCSCACSCGRKC
ncbi:unnamed protein product [Clavelina lepadiformis]|uniref:Uncharacterized protein n=1 Tax=Clavelina lepadiformis TaxID=159417 RepID=A0ABP0GP29_CLALP